MPGPLNYLEGNPESIYALRNLGETFTNAILGMQQNRIREQQFRAQQAMQAAHLRLAYDKEANDQQNQLLRNKLLMAQTRGAEQETSQAIANAVAAQRAGLAKRSLYPQPDMMQGPTIEGARRLAVGDLAQNLTQVAGANPAAAERMLQPLDVGRGHILFDPLNREKIVEGLPPAPPSAGADPNEAYRRMVANALIHAGSRPVAIDEDPVDLASLLQLGQKLAPPGLTLNPSSSVPTFGSENEARAAGHKTGSKIRLRGVGVVELH